MARPRVGGFNHISRYELIIHDYPIYEMIFFFSKKKVFETTKQFSMIQVDRIYKL